MVSGGTGFVFVESPAEFREEGALIVRIPRGIRSKEKLFAVLADKLRFPRYFGSNWDALEECLRDLSWLPTGQAIALVHGELPFGPGGENRGIYLDLLRDISSHWAKSAEHKFTPVFPEKCQAELTSAAPAPH